MAWRIETDPQPDYFVLRILGEADGHVSEAIVASVLRELEGQPAEKLLIDIREVNGRLSVLETFDLVSRFPSLLNFRAAIVDRPENREWFEFYETVSVNRGYRNKVFTDVDEALEWLLG